ncbi:MAG: hypothetical protein ACP5OG_03625 [Candidatus Nanoarchaeia archaeon]
MDQKDLTIRESENYKKPLKKTKLQQSIESIYSSYESKLGENKEYLKSISSIAANRGLSYKERATRIGNWLDNIGSYLGNEEKEYVSKILETSQAQIAKNNRKIADSGNVFYKIEELKSQYQTQDIVQNTKQETTQFTTKESLEEKLSKELSNETKTVEPRTKNPLLIVSYENNEKQEQKENKPSFFKKAGKALTHSLGYAAALAVGVGAGLLINYYASSAKIEKTKAEAEEKASQKIVALENENKKANQTVKDYDSIISRQNLEIVNSEAKISELKEKLTYAGKPDKEVEKEVRASLKLEYSQLEDKNKILEQENKELKSNYIELEKKLEGKIENSKKVNTGDLEEKVKEAEVINLKQETTPDTNYTDAQKELKDSIEECKNNPNIEFLVDPDSPEYLSAKTEYESEYNPENSAELKKDFEAFQTNSQYAKNFSSEEFGCKKTLNETLDNYVNMNWEDRMASFPGSAATCLECSKTRGFPGYMMGERTQMYCESGKPIEANVTKIGGVLSHVNRALNGASNFVFGKLGKVFGKEKGKKTMINASNFFWRNAPLGPNSMESYGKLMDLTSLGFLNFYDKANYPVNPYVCNDGLAGIATQIATHWLVFDGLTDDGGGHNYLEGGWERGGGPITDGEASGAMLRTGGVGL